MRVFVILGFIFIVLAAATLPADPGRAQQSCADDYISVETITGKIVDIFPAPEPFPSVDIYMTGPNPCARMWLQALKIDMSACRPGDTIEATGVVTMDPENGIWEINSGKNTYMMLGQDFTCR